MSKSSLVTNGKIRSMPSTDSYRDNYDKIFNKKQLVDDINVQKRKAELQDIDNKK